MPPVVTVTPVRRIDVTGADRLRYLDDVTSQRLADVPAGHVVSTLYLDVHGAPLAMFDVAVLDDRAVLLVPDAAAQATVVEVLGGRTFLLDARFEATDDEVAALRGDDAAPVATAAGLAVDAGRVRRDGAVLLVGRDGGVDVAGPHDAVADAVARLRAAGAAGGDERDLLRWRVTAGVPAWGTEVTAPHLPEEAGVLPTHVHLAKGCYPGQEAVARMWMLGRPRRRLAVVAPVDGTALEPGQQFGSGRRSVTVTSVSPDDDRALAYVPVGASPGDVFTDDDRGVEVVRVIGTEAPPGHDPAVTQRRDRPRA